MDKENVDEEYVDERKDKVQQIVDGFWQMVCNEYDADDLSEEEMLDTFAAIGIIAGAGMNEAFYMNITLPYQLFGVLSDMCFQTQYSARYGLDMDELENARQNTH